VTDGGDPDGDVATSQELQTCDLQRSPTPPSAPALPQPSCASPGPLQMEQDRRIPAGSALGEAEQASAPQDTTCGKRDWRISRASSPPGVEAQHTPRPASPQLEECTDRESTPRRDSGGESGSDDEAEPPLAKPRSGLRRSAIDYGDHRSLRDSEIILKDRDEAVQQFDGQDTRKRLKTSTPAQPTLRTSTGRRTRSNGTFGSQQVQTSAPGRKRSGRRSIPSPPSSQGSGDEEVRVQVPTAKFEEWALEDVVLKRVTANGLATFQLQFVWDSCVNHRRKDPTIGRLQYQSPVTRRPTAKRGASTRARFTPEEDDLLVELKNQGLPWQDIHKQFTDAFPQRERRVGSLQVRYCTKLKGGD
jgi:hypothetical protein